MVHQANSLTEPSAPSTPYPLRSSIRRFVSVQGTAVSYAGKKLWYRLLRRQNVYRSIADAATHTEAGWPGELPGRMAFVYETAIHSRSDASRIAYMGDLSPRNGVVDFQTCAIAWAEQFPDRQVEIRWFGRGDLEGVLRAQPIPSNVLQSFFNRPHRDELVNVLSHSDVLVVPGLTDVASPYVAEVMLAGLPVLGSIYVAQVRKLVVHGESGWLFDPLRVGEMFTTLHAALTASPEQLNAMRRSAIAEISNRYMPKRNDIVSANWRPQPAPLAADIRVRA